MLITTLLMLITVIALPSLQVSSTSATRLTSLVLASTTALSYHGCSWLSLGSGISLYSGLIQATPTSYGIDLLLGIIGAIAIIPWAPLSSVKNLSNVFLLVPTNTYHSLLVLFTVTGSSILVSSASLLILYLGLELQSFSVYVLAALYRESESATNAGLVYFMLGGLSSAFILLGSTQLYVGLGVISLEEVYSILSMDSGGLAVGLGLTALASGLYFKLAAVPFHQWAPTVYDGAPTIITTWLQTIPKLAVLGLLLELTGGITSLESSLIVVAILSLSVGSIIGLSQVRVKPLLTYSTISHVGFMLLALGTYGVESVTSFSFYLAQYSITSLATLLIVLALGYTSSLSSRSHSTDLETLSELTGQASNHPMLCLGLAALLFSIAGVPPFIGFYAKVGVLEASVTAHYTGVAILAILASAISASYYLKVVRLMYFTSPNTTGSITLTATHTFTVSIMVLTVSLYMLIPSTFLDSTRSLAISVYHI